MRIRLALPTALLLLAACAQTAEAPLPVPDAPATTAPVIASAEVEDMQEVEMPPLPSDKPLVPPLQMPLAELVGADESRVSALLGEPDLREDRAPATAWVYLDEGCSVTLLFYPDIETAENKVLSYDTEGATCGALGAEP